MFTLTLTAAQTMTLYYALTSYIYDSDSGILIGDETRDLRDSWGDDIDTLAKLLRMLKDAVDNMGELFPRMNVIMMKSRAHKKALPPISGSFTYPIEEANFQLEQQMTWAWHSYIKSCAPRRRIRRSIFDSIDS